VAKPIAEKAISAAPYCAGVLCFTLSFLNNNAAAIGAVCVLVATGYNIWYKQKQLKEEGDL